MTASVIAISSYTAADNSTDPEQVRKRMQASKMMQVRVHPGLYKIARQAAADRFCDMSDYVRQALRERLERDGYNLATGFNTETVNLHTQSE